MSTLNRFLHVYIFYDSLSLKVLYHCVTQCKIKWQFMLSFKMTSLNNVKEVWAELSDWSKKSLKSPAYCRFCATLWLNFWANENWARLVPFYANASAPKIKCPTLLVLPNSSVHLMQVYFSVNMGIKYRESWYPHVTCFVDLLLRLQAWSWEGLCEWNQWPL